MRNDSTATTEDGVPQTLVDKIASHKNALTLKEFAEIFNIAYKTAYEMAVQQRIPAIQIGSNWRLDPVELVTWFYEQKSAAKARGFRQSPRRHRPLPSTPTVQAPAQSHIKNLAKIGKLQSQLAAVSRRLQKSEKGGR